MNKERREKIIERLNIMRSHGQFDEFNEEKMKFEDCSDKELEYYETEWFPGQFEE